MSQLNQIVVRGAPISVEIDPACHSAYVRFKQARVEKTISDERTGGLSTIDLDSKGEVIGVELVHVKEFSISCIRHHLPERFKRVDLDKARFVVPNLACANRELACA